MLFAVPALETVDQELPAESVDWPASDEAVVAGDAVLGAATAGGAVAGGGCLACSMGTGEATGEGLDKVRTGAAIGGAGTDWAWTCIGL